METAARSICKNTYPHWEKQGLRTENSHFELIENGILAAEDQSIVFNTADGIFNIPVYGVRNINIYSDTQINLKVLSLLQQHGITLSVFDRKGKYLGRFCSDHSVSRADCFLKQVQHYLDPEARMEIARRFVEAEIFNMRANLKYYSRRKEEPVLTESAGKLAELRAQALTDRGYDNLLLHEARAKELYYHCFDSITGGGLFAFGRRSTRPPENPLNAMMSFGNVVLYNFIAGDIHKSSLDIKVGYLHATGRRNESLNLDLAEIYKPVVVDRVIFHLAAGCRMGEDCFEPADGGVYLSAKGKRIFLESLFERIGTKVQDRDGSMQSFEALLWKDIHGLQRHIEEGEPFRPYHAHV